MRVDYKKPLVWPREGSYATRPGAGVTGKPSRNEISYIQANLGGFRGRNERWAPDPVRDQIRGCACQRQASSRALENPQIVIASGL
jgi:hypothetical protein